MNAFRLSIIGQLLLNALLLFLVWKCTPKGSFWRKVATCVVSLELIAFIGFYVARWHLPLNTLSAVLRGFNSYYIGLTIFLFWLVVAFLLLELAKYLRWIPANERLRKARAIIFLALIPMTILLCMWGYRNTFHPQVTHYSVEVQGACPEKLRLALITDVHIGEYIGVEQVKEMARLVRAEQPDYVLMGGDIMDYLLQYAERPGISEAMNSLHPKRERILYVLGNHEYYYQLEEKETWIRRHGVLLKDSVLPLTEQIWLIGRDDKSHEARQSLSQLVAQLPPYAVKLLLDHQPTEPQVVRENGIDLSMHGHTHRGQFIPFRWALELYYERAYGYYQLNEKTHHIISSGYGISTAPFRIGTRAEVVVIDLKVTPQ